MVQTEAAGAGGRKLETGGDTLYGGAMVAPSRHVLPHGARLRGRADVGPVGIVAALGAIVLVLWADHALAAGGAVPKALKIEGMISPA